MTAPKDGDDGSGAPGAALRAGLGSALDESLQLQLALSEREEQLRLAIEAAEIGLWDVDPVRDLLYWPPRVKAMFGISPEVPVSMRDFYQCLHPVDRDRTTQAFAAALDPAQRALYDVEYRTIGKEDRRIRWVAAKGRGLFNAAGRCVRVIGTAIDITPRKDSEALLSGQQRILEQIATGAPTQQTLDELMLFLESQETGSRCGLMLVAEDGEHFRRGSGPSLPEAYHAALDGIAITPPYLGSCGEAAQRCAAVSVPDVRAEERYPGAWRELLLSLGIRAARSTPVRDGRGEVMASLVIYYDEPRDPTPNAARLIEVGTHLAAIALERARHETRQQRARQALLAANRQKDEFLAMLAHELRNPLAPIRNAGELLSLRIGPDPQLQRPLAMITRQTQQLSRLVDDLLDVSRLAQGRINLTRQTLEVQQLLEQGVEIVQAIVAEKAQHLHVDTLTEPLYVVGDRTRLVQCLGNLLHNAAKFTGPGGEIHLTVRAQPRIIELEVRDSGAGISPEVLPHVFELFVQGEQTLDRSRGGLGIGLAVVRRLVEMHGGTVSATSAGPGRGASFCVRLPRAAPPESVRPAPVHTGAGPVRHVLVVDDNVDAADSLALLLESYGHNVRSIYDSSEALRVAAESAFDVILLDIGLPGMDGYAVARHLREGGFRRRLVALTGYGQPEDRERTHAAGFDAHLVKPADIEALLALLASG